MKIKKTTTIIILLILNISLVFALIVPLYAELRSHQSQAVLMEKEYIGKSDYYSNISSTLQEINRRSDAMEKINSALPPEFSFAPLVSFFQEKSFESGLLMESLEFSHIRNLNIDSHRPIKSVIMNIRSLGEYGNFKQFLLSLENSSRIFQVNRISFAASLPLQEPLQLQDFSQIYRFSMELETYSY